MFCLEVLPYPRLACGQSQLHKEYLHMLDAVTDKDKSLQMQAEWGNRLWCKWIANILGDLQNHTALQQINLILPSDDEDLQAERVADADLFYGLTVRTAAQRAWMMMSMHDLPPATWKGIFHRDPKESRASWTGVRQDALCVQKAIRAVAGREHPDHEAPVLQQADCCASLVSRVRMQPRRSLCVWMSCGSTSSQLSRTPVS